MQNPKKLVWLLSLTAVLKSLSITTACNEGTAANHPNLPRRPCVGCGKSLSLSEFHHWMREHSPMGLLNGVTRRQRAKRKRPVSFHGRADDPETQTPVPSILEVVSRAIFLGLTFTPVVFLAIFAALSRAFRNRVWFPLLVRTLATCGAAFIKWGQWASTRPDMFPESLCSALAPLTHMAPTHSWKHTKVKVERELGCKLEEYFDQFDRKPLASGSVAQVYKATLCGHPVAVKVTHPKVAEQISLDFRLMAILAAIIDSIPGLGFLNLKASMDQFSHTMAGQARLDVEADHLDLFNHNFRRWKDTKFPIPLFKSYDVLIESYEDGMLISAYSLLYQQAQKKEQQLMGEPFPALVGRGGSPEPALAHFIVTRGEHVYLKMLLVDNLMHADLHPGNILVKSSLKDGNAICVLDAGMVARLTEEEQRNFIGFIANLARGNGNRAAKYILNFSTTQTCTEDQKMNFIRDIELLFEEKCRGYGTGTQVADVLCGALTLIRKHQVRIDANYATLIMNILCLDGLVQDLQPEYSIIDGAKVLLDMHSILKWPLVGKLVFRIGYPLAELWKKRSDRRFWKHLQKTRVKRAQQSMD
mmetsp:Transcript_15255/g.20137  ORF Transcript_15255/g.20137 Transcript_15255/m.20137 type:complete len:587 (+) Transcript_15255:70-1830(+)